MTIKKIAKVVSFVSVASVLGLAVNCPGKEKDDLTGLLLLGLASQQAAQAPTYTVKITGKYVDKSWGKIVYPEENYTDLTGSGTASSPYTRTGSNTATILNTHYVKNDQSDRRQFFVTDIGAFTVKGYSKDAYVASEVGTFLMGTEFDSSGDKTLNVKVQKKAAGDENYSDIDGQSFTITVKVPDGSSDDLANCTVNKPDGIDITITLTQCEISKITYETLEGSVTSNVTTGTGVLLKGPVYVEKGATLTIPAGAKVLGSTGSFIVVKQGGKLIAEGTKDNPIVFTSAQSEGNRAAGDWGGIVLIGKSNGTVTSEKTIEGDSTASIKYKGGTDYTDSSGTLKYVRVEFAGNEIAPGDELNSISGYSVGSGTTLEYIQILRGYDDGFEFWGGNVKGKYWIVAGVNDDDFDFDEGFAGFLQFLIGVKYPANIVTPSADPHGFEMDGRHSNTCVTTEGQECSNAFVANYTVLGYKVSGGEDTVGSSSRRARAREGMMGYLANGIMVGFGSNSVCDSTTGYSPATTGFKGLITDAAFSPGSSCSTTGTIKTDATATGARTQEYNKVNYSIDLTPTFDITTDCESPKTYLNSATKTTAQQEDKIGTTPDTFFTDAAYCGAIKDSNDNWWKDWTNWRHN